MSDPKWTPGPWRLGYHDGNSQAVVMNDHIEICTCWHHSVEAIEEQMEANAHLIRTAPELYAQLEDARVTLEKAAKLMVSHYPSVANNLVNQCGIRCGDVLAKARGER